MVNPAQLAIDNRLLSALVVIGALAAGALAYFSMPRFEDPEFTIRTAQVVTQYPGASPEEVANEVSETLETAIQGMQEVEEIRSTSSAGQSLISVDIRYQFSRTKSDLQLVWGKLRDRLAEAVERLPPGAGAPHVYDDFGDVYGLYYVVTGPGFTAKELADYAETVRKALLSVDGVGKVRIAGEQAEAIYVEISRERASALGVSVERIYQDLAQQNAVAAAGDLLLEQRRLVIHPSGEVDSVTAIENVVVAPGAGGALIRLKDVATVTRTYQEPRGFSARYNGQDAIVLGVAGVSGANIARVGAAIDDKLRSTEGQRPWGVEVHEFYHQGKVVDAAVTDFALNVLLALVIVLATLLVFMGLKAALVIGATLVVTVAATLATMDLVGIPMHRISLGALIIALGMLVDNAIVVADGILVGVQQGRDRLAVARDTVSRTKWPLLGGTVVGIIAFAPIGFAPGTTAEYTGHLFWVVMISLLFSWLFALTLVPLLAHLLFRPGEAAGSPASDATAAAPGEGRFTLLYKALMARALAARWAVAAAAGVLFALSVWGFGYVKDGFFPAATTPQLVVDYWLPEGTDIGQTRRDMVEIEGWLAQQGGVQDVHTLVGGGTLRYMLVYGPEPNTSAYGQFLLRTADYDAIARLLPVIQSHLDDNYPNAQVRAWQFLLGPGGGAKIVAEFSGPAPARLREFAGRAKAIMAAGGAVSVRDNWRQPEVVVQPVYSESRGRRLGVSREALANALLTNYSGRRIGVYRDGDDLLPIIARAPADERLHVSSMASIQIASSLSGRSVPLVEAVDRIDTVWRDARMLRVNRVWTIEAQSDPAGAELPSELLERVRPAIEAIELPPGYALAWRGEFGDSAEANESLATTLPIGLLAMVLVVVVLFNALRQPALIWLTVPLALVGVVAGLLATGTPLEFMAILGLLSLSGLLIKNAIVLVDRMDLEIRDGKRRFDAVLDSAASRVRPVTMGALTTILGVLPLLGDAFFRSMAVVLVFGLGFATLLTLVVVPVLYAIFFGVRAEETAAGAEGAAA